MKQSVKQREQPANEISGVFRDGNSKEASFTQALKPV